MASFEESEFEELIGDQIITVRRSHEELLAGGDVELTIDGHKVRLPRITKSYDPVGKKSTSRLTTIFDAANEVYIKQLNENNPIPLLCHREHMTPVGVCRVCVVDVKGAPRLVPACQRPIEPGMEVATIATSPNVRSAVGTLVELLLSDYHRPHGDNLQYGDTGENELEALARSLGIAQSRFPRGAATRPRDDSSLLIAVDHNACILCDRCIRGCNEIRHNDVIGRMGKGYSTRIAFDLDDAMGNSSCVTCGECMVSCPTGALTNRAVVSKGFEHEGEMVTPEQLAALPLFQGISLPFLRWNENAVIRRRFNKGEVVCREGDYGSTAFIMERGRFEVRLNSALGRVDKRRGGGLFGFFSNFAIGLGGRDREADERQPFIPIDAPVSLDRGHPVAILDPSDVLFGEMTCMSHYPRSATVTALDDCSVLEIQRNVLYMLQRNAASRKLLDDVYRRRTLETHLRSVRMFAELIPSAAEFHRFVVFLQERVQLVRVHPGQVIVRQGDLADYFYMVRSGFVKVSQTRQGVPRTLNYIGPGGYFGEIGLLGNLAAEKEGTPGVRVATCSALDHVDLVRMDKETFLTILEMFPQVREHVVEVARQRLEENERQRTQVENVPLGEFLDQGLMNAGNVLVLDLERCTRCDECTKACADSHDGVTRLIREGLRFDKYLVASSCRSCLDPYCLVGCPTAAIERTEAGDINIKDTCIGCGKCAENCPYGNINMVGFDTKETTAVGKGDRSNLCAAPSGPSRQIGPVPFSDGRIAVRRQKATTCDKCVGIGQPSCVYACPHEAAHRMEGKELLELVRQRNLKG